MNWSFSSCSLGDIIRCSVGSLFHYGIFVSEEEVIQFGYNPTLREKDKENIVVIATDIDTFACGQMVQVGKFVFGDHKKRLAPELVAERARARLGEGGYNIIHNNCEHFAFECYSGVKYSSQEEEARKKWSQTPYLNIYVSSIPSDVVIDNLCSKERNEEIQNVSNEEVKKQKYWVWKVLELAVLRDLKLNPNDVKFIVDKNGKWSCDNFNFSLSHTSDIVAVAISNEEVGVDIENIGRLNDADMKLKNKILHKKENAADNNELLNLWTRKEAIFKYIGKSSFVPNKILVKDYPVSSFNIDDKYILSVCGKENQRSRFYGLFSGKIGLYQGKVEKIL